MKVERSSVDQVKKRFEMLKKKKEEKTKEYDLSERIQELKEEVISRKTISGTQNVSHTLILSISFIGGKNERIQKRKEER